LAILVFPDARALNTESRWCVDVHFATFVLGDNLAFPTEDPFNRGNTELVLPASGPFLPLKDCIWEALMPLGPLSVWLLEVCCDLTADVVAGVVYRD
ncbi:hypothetical protein KCU65_g33, partial [Aureobasidium melanogenum]